MAIPESQLATWSNPGASTTAKSTRETVERVLKRHGPEKDFDVYLQGSYRNSTNIYGDSDVDVVVQLNSTFQYEISHLDTGQQQAFHRAYPTKASYLWQNFRRDVLGALIAGFGAGNVSEGSKCLKIAGGSGRLPCDVVPCLDYRHYNSFTSTDTNSVVHGIVFWSQPDSRKIINFPKPHYANGVTKNANTSERFKPVVRMLKNARNAAIKTSYLEEGVAPSYFEECFVYNAPSSAFDSAYADCYCNIVNFWANADLSGMPCQNGVIPLFGSTPEQWSGPAAKQLITGLTSLWNNWR
jgi:hypothetical protein